MIGPHSACLGRIAAQFAIAKLDFGRVEHGAAEQLEDLEVSDTLPDRSEGDRGLEIAPTESDPVLQSVTDLLESGAQGPFKGRAAILLQRLLRNEKRHDLPLAHLDVGKTGDRFRVDETEVQLIILDRQPELIAHELDVALDRLLRDLQLAGELATVGKFPRLQLCVQLHHARERRTGKLFDRGARQAGRAVKAWFYCYRTLHVRQIAIPASIAQALSQGAAFGRPGRCLASVSPPRSRRR